MNIKLFFTTIAVETRVIIITPIPDCQTVLIALFIDIFLASFLLISLPILDVLSSVG